MLAFGLLICERAVAKLVADQIVARERGSRVLSWCGEGWM
jgi:hypothetical protein